MHRRALTLMELLLVLALIACTGALSIPLIEKRLGAQYRLSVDAANVADRLRAARQFALDNATPVCFRAKTSDDHAAWFPVRIPDQRRALRLSEGHFFASDADRSTSMLRASGSSEIQIIFREDGSSSGGRLHIQAPSASRLLTIERSTGLVTMGDEP